MRDDARLHTDAPVGVQSVGRLAREHNGVSKLEHRIGNVRHLSASWAWVLLHGLEHLRGDDDGLARLNAHAHHLLLPRGHLPDVHLDAQVTARHHDTIGGVDNLLQVLEGLCRLHLRDDHRRRSVLRVRTVLVVALHHVFADQLDALRRAHKARGDAVDVVLDAERDVCPILGRQRRQPGLDARQVDALALADLGRVDDLALHRLVVHLLLHHQADQAVVQEHLRARHELLGELVVAHVQVLVVGCAVEGRVIAQHDHLALDHLDLGLAVARFLADLEATHPDLRALGVEHQVDPLAALGLAQVARAQEELVLGRVREVAAHHRHSGGEALLKRFKLLRSRADGGHDLGERHSRHHRRGAAENRLSGLRAGGSDDKGIAALEGRQHQAQGLCNVEHFWPSARGCREVVGML